MPSSGSRCQVLCLDAKKSEAARSREKLLIAELVTIVNKRDELVQNLDSQERGSVQAMPAQHTRSSSDLWHVN